MTFEQDTIVAISTPPGRGGIGIVRLSGPRAKEIAEPLLRLRHALAAGQARFAEVLDPDTGLVLDEAVVTYFQGPRSYTSEDVVEIAAHGSPVLLGAIVQACLDRGARLAEPGEFTQRAFLAGRLDLTQAEAVHDLIESSTLHQARVAARQLGGSLSRVLSPIKESLIQLIAALEAGIDFAEDDLDLMPQPEIAARIAGVEAPLRALADSYRYGRIVREGFTLAIVGKPNAGKSSLFNRLLQRDRAIVTAQPGTTRDPIQERLSLGGIPVELIDTAGLREAPAGPEGEAERQGIARSGAAMAEADVVLLVVDATDPDHGEAFETWSKLEGRAALLVVNKADLIAAPPAFPVPHRIVSAKTGAGVEELKEALLQTFAHAAPTGDSALITNLRQHGAIAAALAALSAAARALRETMPHEMLLLDLYQTLESLDSLTGATTADDILRLIFSTFCIGK
ncbi:tRNA modification GTPase trmE [Granulicella rosea]|uniref:tRNA modification GTPase MnmE n=1 Tax=Granulicella rosea TaxID=474952 RepID=A0A239DMG4_9BACT|nr:tRNA uridine-5-carboxymethylaminomethyl(34) synthesis GTPase MnmE [Granulicella rosea]SNS33825.1 tRNA modification GTPase trmE [Granulicella rosea]